MYDNDDRCIFAAWVKFLCGDLFTLKHRCWVPTTIVAKGLVHTVQFSLSVTAFCTKIAVLQCEQYH